MYFSLSYYRYFFFGYFFSLVTTFILVTILGAVDFWVVKNVTGRLLVGLRWWSDFDERGKEVWRFQSYDRDHKANTVDAAFFWTSQLIGTLTWAAFLVIKILSIDFFWVIMLVTLRVSLFLSIFHSVAQIYMDTTSVEDVNDSLIFRTQ